MSRIAFWPRRTNATRRCAHDERRLNPIRNHPRDRRQRGRSRPYTASGSDIGRLPESQPRLFSPRSLLLLLFLFCEHEFDSSEWSGIEFILRAMAMPRLLLRKELSRRRTTRGSRNMSRRSRGGYVHALNVSDTRSDVTWRQVSRAARDADVWGWSVLSTKASKHC